METERKRKPTTKSSRVRAKEHRDRKRKYFEDLEDEVKQLRVRVCELENELKLSRSKTHSSTKSLNGQHSSVALNNLEENKTELRPQELNLSRLKEEERFAYYDLPKMIGENPDNVKFTMMDQCHDRMGPLGSLRKKVLEHSFNEILENILPQDYKVTALLLHLTSISEWTRGYKSHKKRQKKTFKKTENEIEDLLQTTKQYDFSSGIIDSWEKVGNVFKKNITKLRTYLQSLIRTQRNIFRTLKSLHNFDYQTEIYRFIHKQDYVHLSDLAKRMEGSQLLDPKSLWQLDSPTHEDDNDIFSS